MILKSSNKNLKHKFKQPPKHFFNHSILTTKYGDLNRKHSIHFLNEIKKIVCKYQHKKINK